MLWFSASLFLFYFILFYKSGALSCWLCSKRVKFWLTLFPWSQGHTCNSTLWKVIQSVLCHFALPLSWLWLGLSFPLDPVCSDGNLHHRVLLLFVSFQHVLGPFFFFLAHVISAAVEEMFSTNTVKSSCKNVFFYLQSTSRSSFCKHTLQWCSAESRGGINLESTLSAQNSNMPPIIAQRLAPLVV